MGLDITAYSHLRAIGQHAKDPTLNEGETGGPEDACYYANHVTAYAYASFPRSFRGIPVLGTERMSGAVFLVGGCYETTDRTVIHDFRAGSYSGYGTWRADLARQFNPYRPSSDQEPDPDLPFYELIWFADNEGCIGELAAAELREDFHAHAQAYSPPSEDASWFVEKYADWTRAFQLAADGGLVHFH